MMNESRKLATACAAIAVTMSFFGLVPLAGAHVDAPTVTAQHAFIGDELFGLDTPESTVLGVLPDQRTAMASTTKIWALDVTVHALEDGCVDLDDEITITAEEAGWGGSSMQDVNGVGIEEGEVIRLEDLIRGMMYPSGNDATYAIARHVAVNCLSGTTWEDFVDEMNAHAATLGVTDTNFENPNGYDDPFQAGITPTPEQFNHYTTARELTILMNHGLEEPYFREVVGFVGTWTANTTGAPGGPKTYSLSFPFFGGYPGYEGAKGGGTQNCNGPNNGCMVMSAQRMGRRVVLSFMQGQPWTEEVGMLDFGFGTIFHPDARGSSTSVGTAEGHEIECFSSNRCVGAVLPPSDPIKLVSWAPDLDGSTITKLDEEILPKSGSPPPSPGGGMGPATDVALERLPLGAIVLASRKGSSVELSRWAMDGSGGLSLLKDGVKAGPATTMGLESVYGDTFLTAITDPDGALVLKSWRLDGTGLEQLDTFTDTSRLFEQVTIAGPSHVDVFTGHRAFTGARAAGGVRVVHVWGVDQQTGAISQLGVNAAMGSDPTSISVAPLDVKTFSPGELFPPAYYAVGERTGGGQLDITFFRIRADGVPLNEFGIAATGAGVREVRIASLGASGILAATRDDDGDVRLFVYEADRQPNDNIAADLVSEHEAPDAGSLELARVPSTHAEGDYVTSVTDPVGALLRLRAYRSGDRPY
jgi:D-alanyl-D-alanine carboxypeptidase